MDGYCCTRCSIFLMLSGALLLNREYTLSDFFKRRYTRILIPFIFWALLLPIAKMIFLGEEVSFENYIDLFFLKQYWFVWMLIGVYLLIPILNSFFREYGLDGALFTVVIWFIFMILFKEFNGGFLGTFEEVHPYGWQQVMAGYIGYLPLGYYLSHKDFKLDEKKICIVTAIVFVIFTLINFNHTITDTHTSSTLVYYGYRRIVSTVQAICLFLFARYFSQMCENHKGGIKNKIYSFFKDTRLSNAILSLSVCSYGVYLIHYFWFYPINYLESIGINVYVLNPVIFVPIVVLFVAGMGWLTIWILSKVPILKHISGAH